MVCANELVLMKHRYIKPSVCVKMVEKEFCSSTSSLCEY